MTKSRVTYVRISIPKQYQTMISLVARVKFIKTKVILGIIPKVSQSKFHWDQVSNWDHEIKSYSCSNSSTKIIKKQKSGKKCSGLQNGSIRRLQIGAGFGDYKSG